MGKLRFPKLMLLFLSFHFCRSSAGCHEPVSAIDEEWANNITPDNYNQKVPPYHSGCPAEVNISIIPWGVGEISIEHMNFEVNVYLSFRWIDYRLNITHPLEKEFKLEEKEAARIWTPDVAFRNCLHCGIVRFDHRIHKLNLKGKVLQFLIRTSAKLFCEFDLSYYPMDRHVCFIEVETFGDKKDTVILRDGTPFLEFLRNASIPQFRVSNLKTGVCSTADRTAKYMSCIEYQMTFTRQLAYHLMLTYAPSALIVVLTWISFWLEADVAPPRIALGLTSLLTLATQFSNAQKNLPAVSYAKAIDIWMFTCIFVVFGSLLEFAFAYNLQHSTTKAHFVQRYGMNFIKMMQPGITPAKVAILQVPDIVPLPSCHFSTWRRAAFIGTNLRHVNLIDHWANKMSIIKKQQPSKKKTNKIDSVSKVAFPLTFLVFNVCYWGYFCTR